MNALVLSGGALFGAYQAGAWASLADRFHPHLVVGVSVGAINAYLIASGADPDFIIDRWRLIESCSKIRIRPRWNPLDGWIDARPLELMLEEICDHWKPQIPLAVVSADLRALRPVVFQSPNVGWQHLAASCALLGLFPQYRIDGRRHTDGGLMGALPVWAAEQLGATRILGIHVLPKVPWIVRAPARMLGHLSSHRPRCSTKAAILAPKQPLGGLRAASCWNRENIERWVEEGRRDAELFLSEDLVNAETRTAECPTQPIRR